MRIVITCRQMARDVDLVRPALEELGLDVYCPPVIQELRGDQLVEALQGAVGVIAGDDQFTAEVMARCPELKVISKWGIGVDAIDRVAAARQGILVTNTPGAFDDDVADVTIGYLILLARRLHQIDGGVRRGDWPKPVGIALGGKTLGVVGLGGIGRAVAKRALIMGMDVRGSDPSGDSCKAAEELGVTVESFDYLLGHVDFLSLNCPLTPDTWHLLDSEGLARMRDGAYLVNTSRGPVIDEPALVAALLEGKIAGAALDVFEDEPLPATSPLRELPQVILGSHNASNTREAGERTHWRALHNLVHALGMEMP